MKLNFAKIIASIWLFFSGAKAFVQTYVLPAINIVELIKSFVAGKSPDSDMVRAIITRLFPSLNIDDVIKNIDGLAKPVATAIRNIFPGSDFSQKKVSDIDCIKGFIQYLTTLDATTQNALYLPLAAALARVLSGDNDSSDHHLQTVTQAAYSLYKKDTATESLNLVEGAIVIPFANDAPAVATESPAGKNAAKKKESGKTDSKRANNSTTTPENQSTHEG